MKNLFTFKRLLWAAVLLFLLMNVIAGFHAYKFTHFSRTASSRTGDAKQLSVQQKVATLFFGVDNPRPVNKATPARPFTTIRIQSRLSLEAWSIPTEQARGTVILFHGFSGEKSSLLDKAEIFSAAGYHTLLVDFPGSGGSEGNRTSVGYQEAQDVKAAVEYVQQSGEGTIILFGTSMGSAAIMKALQDYTLPVQSVILECPFGSMLETVEARFAAMHAPSFPMARLLVFWGGVFNGYNAFGHNPMEYASSIHTPTLLLWGELDYKVSRSELDRIYQNLQGPKTLKTYPGASHELPLTETGEQWARDVKAFLAQHRTRGTTPVVPRVAAP